MSTTSCPRCSGQVTLPVGAGNDATVRCPLCHAHYPLTDALVNMPPLLELVEDADEALPSDWFEAAPGDQADAASAQPLPADEIESPDDAVAAQPDAAEASTLDGLEFRAEEADASLSDLPGTDDASPPAELAPRELPDEALASNLPPTESPQFDEPLAAAGEEEPALDFGSDALTPEASEAETLEFGAAGAPFAGDDSDASDEVRFDLDTTAETTNEDAATIEFAEPVARAEGDDAISFDFDEPAEASAESEQGLREFEDLRVDASGEAEDIPLDVPTAAPVAPVATSDADEAAGGKKKKKKKEKAPRPPRDGKSRRSLVGVALAVLLAVPVALYGALWINEDYDFLGIARLLPSAVAPGYANQKSSGSPYVAARPALPPPDDAGFAPALSDDEAFDSADGTDSVDASEGALPADAEAPGDDAMPAEAEGAEDPFGPADEPEPDSLDDLFGPSDREATPEDMPAEDAAPDALDDLFGPSDSEETPAEAMPADDPFAPAEDMPAEDAAPDALDDLFGPSDREATPAEAMPADDPFAPATQPADEVDDLFGPTESDAMPAEEADDPFAPAESRPAEDSAPDALDDLFGPADREEMPAEAMPAEEDDPFGPVEEPADDPFGPVDREVAPVEEMPADDPFAPAPAAPRDARPADADPFAPAETESLPEPGAAAAEEIGPRKVAEVTQADVLAAMHATLGASQQMLAVEANADEAQLPKARMEFYVSLFGMGDAVTLARLGEAGGELDAQLPALEQALRQQLSSDPKRLDDLKRFSARWFAYPKRTTPGIVLAGTVESSEQVGPLHQTKVRLGHGDEAPIVTLVSSDDARLTAGDEILALGTIVEHPVTEIAGYDGSDASVVWSGLTLKLAPR